MLKSAFDAEWYLNNYPDVAEAGVAPLLHYVDTGWREARNPSAVFDTAYYIVTNRDRQEDECPLVHYVLYGAHEGRPGKRHISPERAAINGASDPREQAQHWLRPMPEILQNQSDLLDTLNLALEVRGGGLVLSLSHDDYVEVFGGVQNCIGDEQKIFVARGWTYLHICPAQPLPMLSDIKSLDEFYVQMRLNGEAIGTSLLSELVAALKSRRRHDGGLYFVVHHLLGFSPEVVLAAARQLRPASSIAWIHDYFTLCTNPPLLRNNVKFCGAPPVDSLTCSVCSYGQQRQSQMPRIKAFFEELNPELLAPSSIALDFWQSRFGGTKNYEAAKVVPHGVARNAIIVARRRPGPLRIGFVGAPMYHKGWFTFEDLAARHLGDSRYSFHHLGTVRALHARNIEHIAVSVSSGSRDAMAIAIREAEIDAVVQWSLCYETFSFTSFEALSGGAFVIAREGAGNVWPAVRNSAPERGIALGDVEELHALFAENRLSELLANRSFYEFTLSGVTADYILGRVHV
jgi:hypothetical protein